MTMNLETEIALGRSLARELESVRSPWSRIRRSPNTSTASGRTW